MEYVGQTIQMATTLNKGTVNDHLDLSPEFGSDVRARTSNDPSLRRYSGFLRKDFNVADGPVPDLGPDEAMQHPRRRQNTNIEFIDLPLEEALSQARTIAEREDVVLYLEREHAQKMPSPCYREIVWHPDGWEPLEG